MIMFGEFARKMRRLRIRIVKVELKKWRYRNISNKFKQI